MLAAFLLLPGVSAASLRGVGLDLWDQHRGDQGAPSAGAELQSSWDGLAATARSSLETLIHGVEAEMTKCASGDGCDEQTSKEKASQLHRYKTSLEELAKIEKTSAVSELSKAEAARDSARATAAKLRTVVLGTELGAHALKAQQQLLAEEMAHNQDDQDRATSALKEAERKVVVTENEADEKLKAAQLWATEVQSIVRAAQLSDQYADAMYAAGVEKMSHASAKEERAEHLLKKAGTLADRIEGHLAPKPIVADEHDAPSMGGWGGVEEKQEASTEAASGEEAPDEVASGADGEGGDVAPAPASASAGPFAADAAGAAHATEARIARWRGTAAEARRARWHPAPPAKPVVASPAAAPSPAVAPSPPAEPAVPAASPPAKAGARGDEEMDDIDRELEEIGVPATV